VRGGEGNVYFRSTGVRLWAIWRILSEMEQMMGVALALFPWWLDILVQAINFIFAIKRLYLKSSDAHLVKKDCWIMP
jgi:hypothetical protein